MLNIWDKPAFWSSTRFFDKTVLKITKNFMVYSLGTNVFFLYNLLLWLFLVETNSQTHVLHMFSGREGMKNIGDQRCFHNTRARLHVFNYNSAQFLQNSTSIRSAWDFFLPWDTSYLIGQIKNSSRNLLLFVILFSPAEIPELNHENEG